MSGFKHRRIDKMCAVPLGLTVFDGYLPKLLKLSSPGSGLTKGARTQLNGCLGQVISELAGQARRLCIDSSRKTISTTDVYASLCLLLPGVSNVAVSAGNRAVVLFRESEKKGSRQSRAGLIFPPSIAEKFIRDFGNCKLSVSEVTPIALSACVQSVASYILCTSVAITQNSDRVRVTQEDIRDALKNENLQGISRIGCVILGGVRNGPCKEKFDSIILPRSPFEFVLRAALSICNTTDGYTAIPQIDLRKDSELSDEETTETKVSEETENCQKLSRDVVDLVQYCVESRVVSILNKAQKLADHAGRIKVLPVDIQLAQSI